MNPCIYNNDDLNETIRIADPLADMILKFAVRKRKFRIQDWKNLLDVAFDLIIELQLLQLENIIGKSLTLLQT